MELKTVVLIQLAASFLVAFSSVSCMESNIIITKGYVNKLCVDRCRQSTEATLLPDCERGCRFFDYAETSELVDFNETAFHLLCVSNCRDAYTIETNRNVCVGGCNYAKLEIDNILEMSRHLLEEAEKQMNFLDSIMSMLSSTFWSDEPKDENGTPQVVRQPASGQLLDLFGDIPIRGNKLDDKMTDDEVEIFNVMGNEMSIDQSESSFCATRLWLHRLSFILIVLGSVSLLFISFFYLLAFLKHKKSKEIQETTSDSVSDLASLNPPSYETLIKSGYIVVAENYIIPSVHDEKKEKVFSA